MEDLSPDKLAAVYIKIRNAVAEKEDEVKTLKEKQSIIADKMLELCSTLNTNSLQTPEGTITRTVRSNYWTSDWDAHVHRKQQRTVLVGEKNPHKEHERFFNRPPRCTPSWVAVKQ